MRFTKGIRLVTLAGFVVGMGLVTATMSGCDSGSSVQLAPAPPETRSAPVPISKDPKKGGGAGSSGNMNMNPGGNT